MGKNWCRDVWDLRGDSGWGSPRMSFQSQYPNALNNIYNVPNGAIVLAGLFALLDQCPDGIQPKEPNVGLAFVPCYCGRLSLLIRPPSTR